MKSSSIRVLGFVTVLAFLLVGNVATAQPAAMPAAPAPVMAAAPVMAPAPRVAAPMITAMVAAPVPAMVAVPAASTVVSADAAAPAPVMAPAAPVAPEAAMAVAAPPADAPKVEAPKTDPWWKTLLGGLISLLLVFIGSLAAGAGVVLIKWLAKKLNVANVESISAVEKLYESAIDLGINYADQAARKLGGTPDANGKRLEWAIDKAKETIKELGLAEKATEWITTRIEAKLGVKNAGKPVSPPPEPPEAADTPK